MIVQKYLSLAHMHLSLRQANMKIRLTDEGTFAIEGLVDTLVEFQTTLADKLPEPYKSLHVVDQKFEPGSPTAILRSNLICEEALELGKALREENLHQVLKETCDLLYVLLGVVAVYNLPLFLAYDRVHKNNMRKIINGTVNDEGKLTKPPNHPKVDLSDLLEGRNE